MSTESEVERIKRVYAEYNHDSTKLHTWSLELPGNQRILREKNKTMISLLAAEGLSTLDGKRILEVGTGIGKNLEFMRDLGARNEHLTGIDLLPERIAETQALYPEMTFKVANAENLDFPSASFDIVITYVMFSSILNEEMSGNVAREVNRVLKPGGLVLWYDLRYDNPRNRNVRGITAAGIDRLFPEYRKRMKTNTVLPPITVRLGVTTAFLYPILNFFPFMRSHIMAVLRKPDSGSDS